MAERAHGAAAPETLTTISGADWCGQDISRQRHTRVLFVDLDMTEVQNTGAVFTECTFRRSRFNASAHVGAAFVNCTFKACRFFNTSFTQCKFVGSMFDGCAIEMLTVVGGDWSFAGLPGADLRTTSFLGTRLREADLTGARCQGGSLRDVDLSGAWLHSADFSNCDLRGSDLSAIEPENVALKGAVITVQQSITLAQALGLDVRPD
jgi:uncharacterized protein YjbI with pentapeptide repeats